ncbi:MAG: aminotransferase class I/II-fold pyridoxal phosphate-dependent enzyme [Acidobacteriaceae bacterium]
MTPDNFNSATVCVHAGEAQMRDSGSPLATPIVQTSVFTTDVSTLKRLAAGESSAYMYTRYANPTTRAAEEKIAALESTPELRGIDCLVTASGQAATLCAILGTCRAGDKIVAMQDLYGGTLKLFSEVCERFAISIQLVPFSDLAHFDRYLSANTKLVVLESPTNPTLRCPDLRALTDAAHRAGALVLVDNTFATPVLQQPLSLGADMVMHSATKYLGGHSDLTAGALCGSKSLIDSCRRMNLLMGATLDPHASYLLVRGMKTLDLRMERASANARGLAQALSAHSGVARVYYPEISPRSGHAPALNQMKSGGAMLSLELSGGGSAAERFIERLKLWVLATSLGGVESTVSYPVLSSHVGLDSMWPALGITPGLVRLSVGIESHDDLLADLEQALAS